jgi:hypothetical protein
MNQYDLRKAVLHRIRTFEHRGNYTLHISFDDGRQQEIDFEPILHGPIFGALRDPALFSQAQLDPDFGALVWPNGADLDPMVLYDWAAYVDGIIARRQLSEPGTRSSHQTKS